MAHSTSPRERQPEHWRFARRNPAIANQPGAGIAVVGLRCCCSCLLTKSIGFPRKNTRLSVGVVVAFWNLHPQGALQSDKTWGVHMSPPRESQGSTKMARQRPIYRVSPRTRNSAIPGRASKNSRELDAQSFLSTIGEGRKALLFRRKHTIFTQGDPADAVFYLQAGKVRLTVVSKTGKEATIGLANLSAWALQPQ